jgi:hypothetical protein
MFKDQIFFKKNSRIYLVVQSLRINLGCFFNFKHQLGTIATENLGTNLIF